MSDRPVPNPDPATIQYWQGAREHRLLMPKCRTCGKFHFYPRSLCPHCGSRDIEWVPAAGDGSVYSFTVVKRAPSPVFEPLLPYVVAIIALDEGPHLMSNVVGCDPDSVRIGDRVRVDYLDVDAETSLPVFHRIGGAA